MAAAAAAQAQAVNNAIRQTAEKQLETMYKTVECLKDTNFAKFKDQLGRQAYAYEWDAHILAKPRSSRTWKTQPQG